MRTRVCTWSGSSPTPLLSTGRWLHSRGRPFTHSQGRPFTPFVHTFAVHRPLAPRGRRSSSRTHAARQCGRSGCGHGAARRPRRPRRPPWPAPGRRPAGSLERRTRRRRRRHPRSEEGGKRSQSIKGEDHRLLRHPRSRFRSRCRSPYASIDLDPRPPWRRHLIPQHLVHLAPRTMTMMRRRRRRRPPGGRLHPAACPP